MEADPSLMLALSGFLLLGFRHISRLPSSETLSIQHSSRHFLSAHFNPHTHSQHPCSDLEQRRQASLAARRMLLRSNQGLITKVVYAFTQSQKAKGGACQSFEDNLEAGMQGMNKAISKFNPEVRCLFICLCVLSECGSIMCLLDRGKHFFPLAFTLPFSSCSGHHLHLPITPSSLSLSHRPATRCRPTR